MKLKLFFLISFISLFSVSNGQWQTSGTNQYSTNSGNIGVGTDNPQAKLHVNVANQDNLGLIIQGNSISTDGKRHYVGLAFDGDYGNGTGNSSQIRSYSNLYGNWGSYLTFHTTDCRTANSLVERMKIDEYGNVGIGISNPTTKLQVQGGEIWNFYSGSSPRFVIGDGDGNGQYGFLRWNSNAKDLRLGFNSESDVLYVKPNGNIGIGTDNPGQKLTVQGGEIWNFFNGASPRFVIGDGTASGQYGFLRWNSNAKDLRLGFNGESDMLTIKQDGNVLIGKTTQTTTGVRYKLDVAGPIRADEIVVNTNGADFVFEPAYNLRSLNELETYIKEHKHLPEIAPAKEMQENGVSAGELQTKILQKIEELTLYTIEQNKKLVEQNIKMDEQEKQLEEQTKTNTMLLKRLDLLEKQMRNTSSESSKTAEKTK